LLLGAGATLALAGTAALSDGSMAAALGNTAGCTAPGRGGFKSTIPTSGAPAALCCGPGARDTSKPNPSAAAARLPIKSGFRKRGVGTLRASNGRIVGITLRRASAGVWRGAGIESLRIPLVFTAIARKDFTLLLDVPPPGSPAPRRR